MRFKIKGTSKQRKPTLYGMYYEKKKLQASHTNQGGDMESGVEFGPKTDNDNISLGVKRMISFEMKSGISWRN
ncbi:hypothetical protein Lal_00014118 [Lupinus albus]|nr:hypothetical protein Lal_00014118 [Lupinus albus]